MKKKGRLESKAVKTSSRYKENEDLSNLTLTRYNKGKWDKGTASE